MRSIPVELRHAAVIEPVLRLTARRIDSRQRPNVLVHAEEVFWIILRLELLEAPVVGSVGGWGPGCPRHRCPNPSAFTSGKATGAVIRFQSLYNCTNKACKATIFMLDDWKVMNKNAAAQYLKRAPEYQEQLSFIRNI